MIELIFLFLFYSISGNPLLLSDDDRYYVFIDNSDIFIKVCEKLSENSNLISFEENGFSTIDQSNSTSCEALNGINTSENTSLYDTLQHYSSSIRDNSTIFVFTCTTTTAQGENFQNISAQFIKRQIEVHIICDDNSTTLPSDYDELSALTRGSVHFIQKRKNKDDETHPGSIYSEKKFSENENESFINSDVENSIDDSIIFEKDSYTSDNLKFDELRKMESYYEKDEKGDTYYSSINENGKNVIKRYPRSQYYEKQENTYNIPQGLSAISIEVNQKSNFFVRPNEGAILVFDVVNLGHKIEELSLYCDYGQKPCNVYPPRYYLQPGQVAEVRAYVIADNNDSPSNIITFIAQGYETIIKRVHLRIGQMISDTSKPDIWYTFNGDCDGANTGETCYTKTWEVDITAQDDESGKILYLHLNRKNVFIGKLSNDSSSIGLLGIWSAPPGLILSSDFVVGTNSAVYARYTASCCDPKVDIIATDLRHNTYKRSIDVQHQRLSAAEIVIIILAVILLLIIISSIVYLIIRWRRKKQERSFLSE